MCGICGKINFDYGDKVDGSVLKRMMGAISHRGPDDEGMYVSGHVGLGHRRLSIIDLDSGRQPLSNEDDTVHIVFNGEIYNYRELKGDLAARGHRFKTNTDTEVIIHLYEEYGLECLEKLRGMFAFALFDSARDRLFLARDRVGIKPLYYTITQKGLVFSSEIKALLKDPSVEAVADPGAIFEFLSYTYTPGPKTAFKKISKLQPGHYLVFEKKEITRVKYWDIDTFYLAPQTRSTVDLDRELTDILTESVRLHMISDVPVGFLLSGGVDSTAMLSFYQEHLTAGIKTFTIGFDNAQFEDERKYARLAAKRYGVEHYENTVTERQFFDFLPDYVWHMEEPIYEPPAVSLYYITKMAREHVKVLLSGEGGDEVFAGYQTYRNLVWVERLKRMLGPASGLASRALMAADAAVKLGPVGRYAPLLDVLFNDYYYSRSASPYGLFNSQKRRLFSAFVLNSVKNSAGPTPFSGYIDRLDGASILKKMLYVDTKTWLPDRLLLKADKITMANSLELRVPLLDHKVLEFAAGMPDREKLHNFTTKYIFKKILKDRIPTEIIKRKKAGFPIPYATMLRNNRDWVHDVLTDGKTLGRGYFNKDIKTLLIDDWMATGANSQEIFNLLVLELWHRRFIDATEAGSVAANSR